jgi:serine/threonine protein kinase
MDLFDGLKGSEGKHPDKAYWEIGDVIDGLYRVWGIASGDMGTIYFVEHLGWKKNLAAKSIRPELLRGNEAKKAFINALESWINLGFHPHIVTCFYIKEIEGLLMVFTEYVDGISLKKSPFRRENKRY